MMENKLKFLKEYIKSLGFVAIAYSAGVDSTFLLKIAKEVLNDRVIALTAKSPLFPKRELDEAVEFCKKEGIRHIVVEFDIEKIKHNPKNRCYICKKNIFNKFLEVAKENGIKHVLEGSNISDESDYRPGMQAIKELNIKSPLREAGLTKEEITALSGNKKASFACLASRFVYGEEIMLQRLEMVEKAEDLLFKEGFKQFRVRIHGNIARIEVLKQDFSKLIEADIYEKIREFGFEYVTMDLKGYRMGSMNEVLETK